MVSVTHYLAIICAILRPKKEAQEKASGETLADKIILLNNPQELLSKTKNLPEAVFIFDPEGALKTAGEILCWIITLKATTEHITFFKMRNDNVWSIHKVSRPQEDPYAAIIIPFSKELGAEDRLLKVEAMAYPNENTTSVRIRFQEKVLMQ